MPTIMLHGLTKTYKLFSEQTNCEETPPFSIKKPWLACLADNKRLWKERAVIGERTVGLVFVGIRIKYWDEKTIKKASSSSRFSY